MEQGETLQPLETGLENIHEQETTLRTQIAAWERELDRLPIEYRWDHPYSKASSTPMLKKRQRIIRLIAQARVELGVIEARTAEVRLLPVYVN